MVTAEGEENGLLSWLFVGFSGLDWLIYYGGCLLLLALQQLNAKATSGKRKQAKANDRDNHAGEQRQPES